MLDINEFISMTQSYWYYNCKQILGIDDEEESFAFAGVKELKPTLFMMVKFFGDHSSL